MTQGVPYGYDEYLTKRPEDYYTDTTKQFEYDASLYDYIYGEGTYYEKLNAAETDAEFDALESEVKKLWDSVEDKSIEDQFLQMQAEASDAFNSMYGESNKEKQAKQIRAELAEREKIQKYINEAPDVSGAYDPSKIQTYKIEKNTMNQAFLPMQIGAEFQTGDEIDKLYQAVNNPFSPVGEEYFFGSDRDSQLSQLAEINPAYFMTPEQIEVFNKYYNAGDKESAKAFYDGLSENYLATMKTYNKQKLIDEMSRNEYAGLMVGIRALTPEVAGAIGTYGTIKGLIEGKSGKQIQ